MNNENNHLISSRKYEKGERSMNLKRQELPFVSRGLFRGPVAAVGFR